MANKVVDLVGFKRGNLTVIKFLGRNSANKNMWLCQCDCGTTLERSTPQLREKKNIVVRCDKCTIKKLRRPWASKRRFNVEM